MKSNEAFPPLRDLVRTYSVRLFAYGALVLVVFECVVQLVQSRGAAWVAAENGPLEAMQVACLLVAAATLAVGARWSAIGTASLAACAGVSLYAAARESDQLFETFLFDDAYKWLVGVPVAVVLMTLAIRDRRRLIPDLLKLSQKPAATLFVIGGICLCFFCQMLDRPAFWSSVQLNQGWGDQKALAEESAELFAYLLIVFAGFEVLITAKQERAAAQSLTDKERSIVGAVAGASNADERKAA